VVAAQVGVTPIVHQGGPSCSLGIVINDGPFQRPKLASRPTVSHHKMVRLAFSEQRAIFLGWQGLLSLGPRPKPLRKLVLAIPFSLCSRSSPAGDLSALALGHFATRKS
jgi:hypothetical protein